MYSDSSLAEKLFAVFLGRSFKAPLSHSTSLEVTAAFYGYYDWNTFSASVPDTRPFKAMAKALKTVITEKGFQFPLTLEQALVVIVDMKCLAKVPSTVSCIATNESEAPAIKTTPPPSISSTFPKAPSMDDMLMYLDEHKVEIGTRIVGQHDTKWMHEARQLQFEVHCQSYRNIAAKIRKNAKGLKPELVEKALSLASAFEKRIAPECAVQVRNANVMGSWFKTVTVDDKTGNRELGMVDYLMVIQQHQIVLNCDIQQGRIMRIPNEIVRGTFEQWVWCADVKEILSVTCQCWMLKDHPKGREIRWFCFPTITDISATIKKLRHYTEALERGTVFVFSPDERALKVIRSQGMGTLHFPTGNIECDPLRLPEINDDDDDFSPIPWLPWWDEANIS